MTVHHDTLTVSRGLAADLETVFGLWTDPKALERWYLPGDESWKAQILEHTFEIGGRKRFSFGPAGEPPYEEDCRYQDIVAGERILYSMTVSSDKGPITTSMVTVEFSTIDAGTHVQMTEQIVILDGGDTSEDRRNGWEEVFGRLEAEV